MSNRRSRDIRRLMSQTGMNYTRAARELDRQEHEAAASADSSVAVPQPVLPFHADAKQAAGYATYEGAVAQSIANIEAAFRAAEEYAAAVPRSFVEGLISAHDAIDQYAIAGGAMGQAVADIEAAFRAAEEYAAAVPKSLVESMVAAHRIVEQHAADRNAFEWNIDSFHESLTAAQRAADQLAALKIDFIPPSW